MSLLPVPIPSGFRVLVKKGERVTQGQVLADRDESYLERKIPLAKLLNVSPKKAAKLLKKNPGDSIKEGEIIARKPLFVSVLEVVSSASGTMLRFEREAGEVVFEISGKDVQGAIDVVSPVSATVSECSEHEVVLETKNTGAVGVKGTGGKAEGVLFVLSGDKEAEIDGGKITVDMIGNIILAGILTGEALAKSSGMGVAGIILSHIDDEQLALLEEKRMLIPILVVDSQTFEALAKQGGKKVYLDPIAKTVLVSP
ncbi:MAG: hypothetical protein Q8Q49_01345 [bacterium]|nr:hypothetical protein [bacterium]